MAGRLAGAAPSHAMLWLTRDGARRLSFGRPVPFAAACGLLVAMIGVAGAADVGHHRRDDGQPRADAAAPRQRALLTEGTASLVSPDRLYHGLAQRYPSKVTVDRT